MDSMEDDEKLVQMVQDFIESDDYPSSSPSSSSSSAQRLQASDNQRHSYYFALRDVLESGTGAEVDVLKSLLKHMRRKRDAEKTTGLKKWLVMRLKMDGFHASLCHTSWATSFCCPGGDYEYIDVLIKDEDGHKKHHQHHQMKRLIVDVDFKSQFEVARPTQSYKELTDTLPSIFVGDEVKLNRIISLLCSAAKESLRERGLYLPPWRTTTYMLSKWLSESCLRDPVSRTIGAAGGASISGNRKDGDHGRKIKNGASFLPKSMVKSTKGDLGNRGSGLSSQFSNMSINCC
ncbi:uncharacterized protein LOC104415872 [Eucalyptus grandis]|uniref:uncharacterized protein LOC104415872 n=1 Tax=Eucalyptus grandis TaxID=71139 RepID=UPI00192F0FE5|nr:uncharacterized protein LOC104415872 [Eucalyptus grandis]